MSVPGVLFACVIAATPGGAGEAHEDGLRPRRDLFGTAARKPRRAPRAPGRVWGTVELSNGTRARGWLSLTPGRPLEVYDLDAKEWREFEIHQIARLRATPRREELEREWRWKEYGKDEKVYTGRAYPKRWLDHELVLSGEDETDGKGGERASCHIRGAALYLTTEPAGSGPEKPGPDGKRGGDGRPGEEDSGQGKPGEEDPARKPEAEAPKRLRLILRQYERGKLGQTLEDLVYVRSVVVHEKGRAPKRGEKRPTERESPERTPDRARKRPGAG